jgi:PKD repeat protein
MSAWGKLVSVFILMGVLWACAASPGTDAELGPATFTFNPSVPVVGEAVQFTDTSSGGATSWRWDFGDGQTSTIRNPEHAFSSAGSRSVTLTIAKGTASKSASRSVVVEEPLIAAFDFDPPSPAAGQTVRFTDRSAGGPTSWAWDFNDGATSPLQGPDHAFTTPGSYTVTLTITRGQRSAAAGRVVVVAPAGVLSASFSFSPASPWSGGPVQFTDTSTGAPTSWQWDFGDGVTATSRHPRHTYSTAGSRTVTLTVANGTGSDTASRTLTIVPTGAIIVDHTRTNLNAIPSAFVDQARQTLHIAYGHTSHGSQVTSGMTGLVGFAGAQYAYNTGGSGGALDLRDYYGDFGNLGIAEDLGSPTRTAWAAATRAYLAQHPEINVIIWSWCGQVDGTQADIQQYLDLMNGLEHDFATVKFVYMTGHTDGAPLTGNVPLRNQQIRDYCLANNKILFDFADIESYDPNGTYFGDKLANDACDYDSNGDGVQDRNWAIDWQNAHPGEWYTCESAHSQPLNANMKAYAAWHLWARLAGWDGN